jgi:hypothetical protein
MNVEIGAEAALFPEKEYIKGIFVSVYGNLAPLHWIKNQPKCCAIRLLNPLGDPKLSTEPNIKHEQIKIIRLRRAVWGSVAYLRTWAGTAWMNTACSTFQDSIPYIITTSSQLYAICKSMISRIVFRSLVV